MLLPEVVSDELRFSLLGRICALNGCRIQDFASEHGHLGGRIEDDHLGYGLRAFEVFTRKRYGDIHALRANHSLLPYYMFAAPQANIDGQVPTRVAGLTKQEWWKPWMMRYCPGCAQEDRRRLGRVILRRTHQLPLSMVCLDHCMPLSLCDGSNDFLSDKSRCLSVAKPEMPLAILLAHWEASVLRAMPKDIVDALPGVYRHLLGNGVGAKRPRFNDFHIKIRKRFAPLSNTEVVGAFMSARSFAAGCGQIFASTRPGRRTPMHIMALATLFDSPKVAFTALGIKQTVPAVSLAAADLRLVDFQFGINLPNACGVNRKLPASAPRKPKAPIEGQRAKRLALGGSVPSRSNTLGGAIERVTR